MKTSNRATTIWEGSGKQGKAPGGDAGGQGPQG